MANTTITIDQFNNVLKRLEKLEHRHKEIPITIEKDIAELKEDYHKLDKEQATFGEKLDSFRTEFRIEIKSLRTEFLTETRSLEKRLDLISKFIIMLFVATIGIFGTLITILMKLFGVI